MMTPEADPPRLAIDEFFAGKPPGPVPNSVWEGGCYLGAYPLNGRVYFGGIWVPPEARGRGAASKLLEDFLAVMDRHGMAVLCHAAPFDRDAPGLNGRALAAWYARRGFEPDPLVRRGMVRPPRA